MDSVDAALRYLQRQFASVANDEAQWQEERQRLQQQVRDLETQRDQQEMAYKDAMLRVKMLEFALRQERGRYLVSPAPVSTPAAVITKKSSERSIDISRPAVTVSRTMSVSTPHSAPVASPAMSPPPSPLATQELQVFRTNDSTKTPATPKTSSAPTTQGMEISRPRMGSRTASGHEVMAPASDAAKSAKPATITLAPKAAFRPHKLKIKLSGHMDGVRTLAFHPTEPFLVSGSEDCTVRVWNLSSVANGPPTQRATEMDSVLTVRPHTKSVLAVTIIPAENFPNTMPQRAGGFVTAGRDGTVGLFHLPPSDMEKAEPLTLEDYHGLQSHIVKRAHEDAVWDLHAHPLSNVLFSAGADGAVKTWGISSELTLKGELRCNTKTYPKATGHSYRGYLMPTSVHTVITDSKTCVVGYTSGSLAQYDFHGEQLLQLLRPTDVESYARDSRDFQINQIITHPTMPLAIAAHHDRKIRLYDLRAGECVGSLTAHQDAVSCLSIDASGLYVASGGHDGSLRIWSVAERHCVFEQAAHRPKFGEAVHSVAYHPSRNFIATGGADSIIKIYQ